VLAVVVLGVYMSGYGSQRISVEVEHSLHSFWEMIEYLANTIIFVYSGYLIAFNVTGTGWSDWAWSFALYVMLHLVRGGANLLMYPALRKMGYGMDLKMLTMMTWGGLRGAVGLALALMVQLEDTIDQQVRHLIVFHVGIVAALTILINGTFTPKVLDLLGMNKSDPHKERFFQRALVGGGPPDHLFLSFSTLEPLKRDGFIVLNSILRWR
jgi:sodium/hydrogen exchanger 10/11